ncbi:uncharacterized protein [Aristolochia californica]|uniref:uncharacterized protein n=1 Tax=Aristolochia californica TaxID=171875 RepID=UPI0035E11D24
MAGGRGRSCNAQAVILEDLQRQVAELTQHLTTQDSGSREMEDHDSDARVENPDRTHARFGEHCGDRPVDLGFRVTLPEFSGTLQADGFIDWLQEIERIFEYKEVPDNVKVKLVAMKLKGRASAWWEQLQQSRDRQGKAKLTDWEKMKKKMKGQFLPFGYTQTLFQRLHLLRQGSRSVDDYTEEFYQLLARNDLSETEEQLVARYLGGLRQPLQDVLCLHLLWTVSEAFQRALVVEQQLHRRPMIRSDQCSPPARPTDSVSAPPPTQGTSTSRIRCFRCGEQGHKATECRNPASQKGKNLLIEEEVVDEHAEFGEPVYDDDDDGDVLYGDGHATLVVCPRLLTPKVDLGDDWLRTTIFHTTCTVADKVCTMIIDGGSCENIVSEEAVQKLQLKTDRHPKSYKLTWLTKGIEVLVDQCCLVSFSIGMKYFDTVWCDVASMEACHVLLGRPWQYDRRVLHDGRKNTFSFNNNEKKIVLAPHQARPTPPMADRTTLVSLSRVCVEHGDVAEDPPPGLPPEHA